MGLCGSCNSTGDIFPYAIPWIFDSITIQGTFRGLLAFGITAMLFWQVVINIGMVMGLMPVVGIPLPLVSYGGSSVFTTLIGVGLLLNVRSRRFMFQKGTRTR